MLTFLRGLLAHAEWANAVFFHAWAKSHKALSADCGDIEVWRADRRPADGWRYYWLVSLVRGAVRALALVRYSHERDELQERMQGPFAQELWQTVPSEGGAAWRLYRIRS
jgi:hypothetical protein